jgi:hypothetical protein
MKIPPAILAIALAAGVHASLEDRGRHARIVLARGERRRFVTISRTPSDYRAERNQIRDVKRVIREMGE